MQLLVFHFLARVEEYMLPCASKKLLGMECPGCGFQRAILLLFEGEFVAAFQMYPAIYTLIPLALLLVISKLSNAKIIGSLIIAFSISSVGLILINFFIKLIH
ncbi:MAG: DUF2752 domain-containing protein [Bacteroidota bacterium]